MHCQRVMEKVKEGKERETTLPLEFAVKSAP